MERDRFVWSWLYCLNPLDNVRNLNAEICHEHKWINSKDFGDISSFNFCKYNEIFQYYICFLILDTL